MEELLIESTKLKAAEVELIYKSKVKVADRFVIATSKDAYRLLSGTWNKDTIEMREELKVVFLNRAGHVLGIMTNSTGGIDATTVEVRHIFAAALKAHACSIIISHNHPSGALKPSRADDKMTDVIKQGGEILNIKLLDHLIVTTESYFSYGDEGLI
ncbi:RadC family protein [[Flexibacter] sp. ATCC 35208]|uniref:JAB domain-containing protein n=1 Tax=[Flexibacter] sp. ATCC 35208 TaxID=1936242 RepID=UPI0009C54DB9|nr:JAB domain-containing protein [[Flexibacter] sp. ATCC 35208]OMP80105.1 DNA repair protein [[Flexibacter] sp. ATCC 35208]